MKQPQRRTTRRAGSQRRATSPQKGQEEEHDQPDTQRPTTRPRNSTEDGVELNGRDDRDENHPPPPASTFAAANERDHIKIMLATDNHVGYMERDPVRSQDSIRTFEEILQLAVEHKVDMILLGGDLFHENKPSRATMHQVMAFLRQYTLGDRPIQIELLSDPNDGALPGKDFPAINYQDSNLNVSIPVFSIHGNHDDPQGTGETGALSALDLLSVSGLINYFGKIELPSDDATAAAPSTRTATGAFQEKGIRIKPVLLQKGNTKLALYGMGNIKDERMHFELRANRVRMFRPQEDPDSWFNILCVHQNRVAHNPKACVPETMFDDSVHLVVWGHEHEQLIQPQAVTEKRYHITQPGSSIATSLSPGEAVEKCVAIIHVENTDFLIEPIPLKTVRPFVMGDLMLTEELQDHGYESKREDIMKLLRIRVNGLIEKAKAEYAERHADRPMPLPLVRLRVEYTNQEISNPQRFGQEFAGKVANPKDVLQFTKKKSHSGSKDKDSMNAYVDLSEMDLLPAEKLDRVDVGMLVQEYLQAQNLDILNPEGLEGAVLNFVEKDDKDAIDSFVKKMLRNTVKGLVTIDPEEAQIGNELERLRQEQQRRPRDMQVDDEGEQETGPSTSSRRRAGTGAESDDSMMDDLGDGQGDLFDDDNDDELSPPPKRGSAKSPKKATSFKSKAASTSKTTPATSKSRATSSRRAATASKKMFLGHSDEGSDVVLDEEVSTPAPTNRHAAALGLTNSRTATSRSKPAARTPVRKVAAPSAKTGMRQSQLAFAPSTRGGDSEDDNNEFVEPEPQPARTSRKKR